MIGGVHNLRLRNFRVLLQSSICFISCIDIKLAFEHLLENTSINYINIILTLVCLYVQVACIYIIIIHLVRSDPPQLFFRILLVRPLLIVLFARFFLLRLIYVNFKLSFSCICYTLQQQYGLIVAYLDTFGSSM